MKSGSNHDGSSITEIPTSLTMPTAPSPSIKPSSPFDELDNVPSTLPDDEPDFSEQVDEVEIQQLPIEFPTTLTPPLSPKANKPGHHVAHQVGFKLLARLGGYGWRG
jgi:hypothetical protein